MTGASGHQGEANRVEQPLEGRNGVQLSTRPGTPALVLNAGSSSLKFKLFVQDATGLHVILQGQIEGLGGVPWFAARDGLGAVLHAEGLSAAQVNDGAQALAWLLQWLAPRIDGQALRVVGHRVVHGGARYSAPVRVDAAVLAELAALVPLAPLHQPHNLAPITALAEAWPQVPQVACFDTAFHRTQPREAELYALPMRYFEQGVRRYGFHGLSYHSIAERLPQLDSVAAAGRTIVAHLGNGVSLCALQGGRSVATTMGFTALEGCPMGTRSGSLDPGVVLWLAREQGLSLDAIEHLLYHDSGLLGLSGVASDMRQLLASTAPQARVAIDYFTYRIAREIGSLAAALGGLDALVFTAGIGEHSAAIRAEISARCAWLGVQLDETANAADALRLEGPTSRVRVLRVATDEESVIARHALAVVS